MKVKKMLILDDFEMTALGTQAVLNRHTNNFEITCTFSVDEAMELFNEKKFDIVLSDILMPEKDGFEALRLIKQLSPDTKVMFYTVSEDKNTILKAISKGVDGYQFKNNSKEELIVSINAVINGEKYFHYKVMNSIYNEFFDLARRIFENTERGFDIDSNIANVIKSDNFNNETAIDFINKLTKRELEIMQLIGLDFSTKEIAKKLNLSEYTISTHRKNIYVKIGIEKLSELKYLAKQIIKNKNL